MLLVSSVTVTLNPVADGAEYCVVSRLVWSKSKFDCMYARSTLIAAFLESPLDVFHTASRSPADSELIDDSWFMFAMSVVPNRNLAHCHRQHQADH